VCLAFYTVASRNRDGLVVEDAYAAGLAYDAGREEHDRARRLGIDLALSVEPDAHAGVLVRVATRGRDAQPIEASQVTVRRERPAEGGYDADFPLDRDTGGWSGRIALPKPGRWRLVVAARVGDVTARETFAIEAPEPVRVDAVEAGS
jgi:nitrogen fixation protein FixH